MIQRTYDAAPARVADLARLEGMAGLGRRGPDSSATSHAVAGMEHLDHLPLTSLGRVDGGQDRRRQLA